MYHYCFCHCSSVAPQWQAEIDGPQDDASAPEETGEGGTGKRSVVKEERQEDYVDRGAEGERNWRCEGEKEEKDIKKSYDETKRKIQIKPEVDTAQERK